jgi:hypothetical protein
MFTSFEKNDCESGCITFGDNSQGQVLGFGKIAITTEYSISKVLLVESLDYNLLSVSQLCDMSYNCLFTDKGVTVFRRSDGSFAFKGVLRGKLYLVDSIPEEVELDRCLIAKTNMSWLWHRRLAHVGMRNIHKLQKDDRILGLTNTISIGGNKYSLVIVDGYYHFTWVFFLQYKSETQEVLKKFLKRAQNEFDAKVKIRSDNSTEFKNTQVEDFLDEEGIKHEFLAPILLNKMGWPKRRTKLS